MDEPNIIALEGSAFAGKTTLLSYLKKNFARRISVVPEASEYVGGDKNFPISLPFTSFQDARASTQFFLEVEKQRCTDAKRLWQEKKLPVLMDRSTLLTTLQLFYLLESQEKTFPESYFFYALEVFSKAIQTGSVFIPNRLIVLEPKNRDVFESRVGRGTRNSIFTSWKTVEFFADSYRKIIAQYYKESALILKTENTSENLHAVAQETLEFCDRDFRSSEKIQLDHFPFTMVDLAPTDIEISKEEVEFSNIRTLARELMEKSAYV